MWVVSSSAVLACDALHGQRARDRKPRALAPQLQDNTAMSISVDFALLSRQRYASRSHRIQRNVEGDALMRSIALRKTDRRLVADAPSQGDGDSPLLSRGP
jgi:hypothetical protein